MSLYSEAVAAIRYHSDTIRLGLEAKAREARAVNDRAVREAIRQWEGPDSPFHAVTELLAHTVMLGRDDGYPSLGIPDDTRKVICAAFRAGMPLHNIYDDGSGFRLNPSDGTWNADYAAWREHDEYAKRQIVLD